MALEVIPTTQRAAKQFVTELHRHHKAPRGAVFCLAAVSAGRTVGVIMCGRPVARGLQDGRTLEVTRCCTDGTPNACSILYGRARRAAFALGYTRLVTYTLPHEGGASLRAAGFALDGTTRGGSWSCPSRPRKDNAPTGKKLRWMSRKQVAA